MLVNLCRSPAGTKITESLALLVFFAPPYGSRPDVEK